jgi:5-methylcytosine-specific restriction enzyme B
MEPDKRLGPNGMPRSTTVYIRLPYIATDQPVRIALSAGNVDIANPFAMPFGVYTLSSMNSIDRSVAPLDSALRRRFHVVALEPDLKLLASKSALTFDPASPISEEPMDVSAVQLLGLQVLHRLNTRIRALLGPDYCFGQWYLTSLFAAGSADEAKISLVEIWEHRILPQLFELFSGRSDRLAWILGLDATKSGSGQPLYVVEPSDEIETLGGTTRIDSSGVNLSETLSFLISIPAGE